MMKITKILSICMTAALLSSSCSDDSGLQPGQSPVAGDGQPVRISASLGDKGSRLGYEDSDDAMLLTWQETDILKVVNPSSESFLTDFALVEGAGTEAGEFEGKPYMAYTPGDPLYVFYHNDLVETDWDEDGNLLITLGEQDGTLNSDYQLMFGETVYKEGYTVPQVKLNHVVSILKLNILTDKVLTRVELDNNQFRSQATLVLKQSPTEYPQHTFERGELVYCYSDDTDENDTYENKKITLSGQFVPVDGQVTVYAYVLPSKRYGLDYEGGYEDRNIALSFTAYDENDKAYFQTTTFDERQLEQGKFYEATSGVFTIVDFDNEDVADGSMEKPYEIANMEQLYSFMLRCNRKEGNVDGSPYSGLNYKLTNDIKLDGSIKWSAPTFTGCMFDGNGKTVSGKIEDSFFDKAGADWDQNSTTVQNLTLDLEFSLPENHTYGPFGCLAKNAEDADILNCVNRSWLEVAGKCVGGLVGQMDYLSAMIGCANEGNVTVSNSEVEFIGGLVGWMGGSSIIEACYNRGTLNPSSSECDKGSIVAHIGELWNEDDSLFGYNGRVTSCWTTGPVDIVGVGVCTCCYMVDTTPTSDQIAAMNAALEEAGSFYRFDENAQPVNQLKDIGSSSGSDLPIGGIY